MKKSEYNLFKSQLASMYGTAVKKIRRPYQLRAESPRNLYIWWQYSTEQMSKSDIARYHGVSFSRVEQIIHRCELKRIAYPEMFMEALATAI